MTSIKPTAPRETKATGPRPFTVVAVAVAGLFFQVAGLLDWLLIYSSGVDLGINGAFWYRFVCNVVGLIAIGIAVVAITPYRLRTAAALGFALLTTYLAFSPGYYRMFDGPLAEYRVTPIEIIRSPYEPPKIDRKRVPGDKSGPELA